MFLYDKIYIVHSLYQVFCWKFRKLLYYRMG